MKMFRGQPLMADLGAAYVDEARQALLEKNGHSTTARRVDQLMKQIVWSLENEYGEASKKPDPQPGQEGQ